MVHITFGSIISMPYYAGIAEYDRMRGDIDIYVAVRSDEDIVTDGDVADDGGVNAYPDPVTNYRGTHARTSIRLTDDDTFVDVTVSTNACIGVNGDVIVMTYI